MNFLAPLFLIGAALIAGPIIAHLIRRQTRERVPFSTLRFLDESPPKLTRRNRIEHPWLLALRILIVLVLVAAFARPYLPGGIPAILQPGAPQSVVIVVDESASMRREGLWEAAKKKAAEIAGGLGPQDQLVMFSAAEGAAELVGKDQWASTAPGDRVALVKAALDSREPGWGRTRLDTATETGVAEWEQMVDITDETTKRKLVLVSDFAGGSQVSGLAGLPWPKNCEVVLERIAPAHKGNAGMQWLGWAADTGQGAAARVRVTHSDGGAVRLQLRDARTDEPVGPAQTVQVSAGEAQLAIVPLPEGSPPALRLELTGDAEPFDNSLWFTRAAPRDLTLAYPATHDINDTKHARFYLERAVAGWKDPKVKVLTGNTALPSAPPAGPEVIVVSEPLDAAQAAAVRARVGAGAFAVVLMSGESMAATAGAIAGEQGWLATIPGRGDALLGKVDFKHPQFAIFDDPRFNDFTKVRFWKPIGVTLPAGSKTAVVAEFDDGTPAVLETPVGKGRVITWGGDWAPGAGQWVLSTKFVPWLQSLFERAAGGAVRPAVAEVGDAGSLAAAAPARWRDAAENNSAWTETTPEEPGVYELEEPGGPPRLVALNAPVAESKVEPLPLEVFEQLGVPLRAGAVTAQQKPPAQNRQNELASETESRQKLWRWALLGAAALLALESMSSFFISRRDLRNAAPNPVS